VTEKPVSYIETFNYASCSLEINNPAWLKGAVWMAWSFVLDGVRLLLESTKCMHPYIIKHTMYDFMMKWYGGVGLTPGTRPINHLEGVCLVSTVSQ